MTDVSDVAEESRRMLASFGSKMCRSSHSTQSFSAPGKMITVLVKVKHMVFGNSYKINIIADIFFTFSVWYNVNITGKALSVSRFLEKCISSYNFF